MVSVPQLGDMLQSGYQIAASPNLISESCAATWAARNIQPADSTVWICGHSSTRGCDHVHCLCYYIGPREMC